MSDYEGLCDNDKFDRTGQADHWKGTYTRASPKGRKLVAWNHVSASQIENFQKCKRLWFFKSIQKIPEGQKGHQSLGEAFHLIMEKVPQGLTVNHADVAATQEDWAKAEAMAKIALPLLPGRVDDGLDLAPVASGGILREQGIRLPTYDSGPTMVGYIDLAIPPGIGWPAFLIPAEEAIIADYKTLSDFRYMRTPEELANSVQMMTYAKWAISDADPVPEHVRLVHLYARTKPPFIRSAVRYESAIVTPDQINAKWENTLDTVREMEKTSACGSADDVEAGGALNGHCEAYGGCHFRDKCGIVKTSGIKSLFSIGKKPGPNTMSGSPILEKIKAAQAAAAALKAASTSPVPTTALVPAATSPATAETGPAETPASTPVESPVKAVAGPISGMLARISKTGKGRPTLQGAIAASYGKEIGTPLVSLLGDGALSATTVQTLGDLLKLASGIVPPDAPSRSQPVITKPGDQVVDPLVEPVTDEEGEDASDDSGSTLGVVSPSGDPLPSVPAPRRGRPSNAELAAREAAKKAEFDALVLAKAQELGGGDAYMVGIQMKGEIDKIKAELEVSGQHKLALSAELAKMEDLVKALRQERDDARAQAKGQAPSPEGMTLYVDCFPTKGDREVTDFYEWIGPICAQVAKANAVEDYRLINYTSKGLLASAIRKTIQEHGAPKAITIQTFAGGADIALEILTPLAKRVIKKL